MLDIFLAVPGKLKTLLDRLTSTRATALDNLDAAITSRAAASSALSTTQWTNARAGYLDNLATAPLQTAINSIQTGYLSTGSPSTGANEDAKYADVTITSVNTAKSICLISAPVDNGGNAHPECTARLTSATNLRIAGATSPSGIKCRWVVVEFK